MTFDRQMHPVILQKLSESPDEYGQKRQTITNQLYIDMAIILQQQTNKSTPYFIDADAVGLTKFPVIDTSMQVVDNGITYNIKQVYRNGRFVQVHLTKTH